MTEVDRLDADDGVEDETGAAGPSRNDPVEFPSDPSYAVAMDAGGAPPRLEEAGESTGETQTVTDYDTAMDAGMEDAGAVPAEVEASFVTAMDAGTAEAGPALPAVDAAIPLSGQGIELELVTDEDLRQLWQRAAELQEEIGKSVTNLALATKLYEQIEQARSALAGGRGRYEEASKLISLVEFQLQLSNRVRISSEKTAPWLLVYEIVWLAVLIGALFYVNTSVRLPSITISSDLGPLSIHYLANSLIWGGLGGVVGALYALWRHVSDLQDFDSQFILWYLINPLLGIMLGGFIFVVVQAGFFSLTAGEFESINSAAIIYVLAWIAGFRQMVVYNIVQRILNVFQVGEDTSPAATAGQG